MCRSFLKPTPSQKGLTILEMTVTLVVMGLMLSSFVIATSAVLDAREATRHEESLNRDAALAMQRMVTALKDTPQLLLPMADNPATTQNEALREQRLPAETGKERQTAVLAVRMSAAIDRDADGIADADNDGDGRIDEDTGSDSNNDASPGIIGIDDDNDGVVDESVAGDDDEDGLIDEDSFNVADDDTDLSFDEDPQADGNDDGAPGLADVDDDGDGFVDEGWAQDDDEDGLIDEDWYDPVVFYLVNSNLVERQAFPSDLTKVGGIKGDDYMQAVIAENVAYFRVERISRPWARSVLVDITLELNNPGGENVSLNTRIRVRDST